MAKNRLTNLKHIVTKECIKIVEIEEMSWRFAVAEEKQKTKDGLFSRGFEKQNISSKILYGKNLKINTIEKMRICINAILQERGQMKQYKLSEVVGYFEEKE